jgi:cell cycle checkpoint protein
VRGYLRLFRDLISNAFAATAYIFADNFDEYKYTPPPPSNRSRRRSRSSPSPPLSQTENSDNDQEEEGRVAFEIPLNTLIECLNIFGTAGPIFNSNASANSNKKKWRRVDADDDRGSGDERERRRGPIDNYFSAGKDDKRTGMRMSFAGAGYPLTLLM